MTKLSVIWCNFCSFLLNARSNIKIIYYSKTSHCKTRLSVYCKQFNDRYRPSSQYTFLVYLKYVHCAQREMFIFFASNQLLAFAFNCRYHGNPCVIAPDVKTLIPSYFCFFKLFLLVSIHIALNNGLNPTFSIFPLPPSLCFVLPSPLFLLLISFYVCSLSSVLRAFGSRNLKTYFILLFVVHWVCDCMRTLMRVNHRKTIFELISSQQQKFSQTQTDNWTQVVSEIAHFQRYFHLYWMNIGLCFAIDISTEYVLNQF